MKGIESILLAAFLIVSITGLLIPSLSVRFLGIGNMESQEITIKKDIYTMGNALDAAVIYSETALHYSIYQACYDVLRKDALPNETVFLKDVGSGIEANMKEYTKDGYRFLGDYKASLPEYSIGIDGGIVSANSEIPIFIEKANEGETIRLEKGPEITFKLTCNDIYTYAWEKHEALYSELEQIITDELEKPEWKKSLSGEADSCEELFSSIIGKTVQEAGGDISETIKNQASAISLTSSNGYIIETEVPSSGASIASKVKSRSESSGGVVTLNCEFTYSADIGMKVVVRGSETFPVHDGSDVVFAPLETVFLEAVSTES